MNEQKVMYYISELSRSIGRIDGMGHAMFSIAPLFGERREATARQFMNEASTMERTLALLQEALGEKTNVRKADTHGAVKK